MMKAKNIIIVVLAMLFLTQCSDSLKEEFYSATTIETLVKTKTGMDNLVTACYASTKVWYGKEYGWDLTTVGTDLWTYAGDADQMQDLAKYTAAFNNSFPGRIGVVWSEFYKALNACNYALYYLSNSEFDDEYVAVRSAEVSFLRALYTWHIVETWGSVYYSTEIITSPETELNRSSLTEFYTQIFADLNFAVDNLPLVAEGADYGRVHRYAALALRARAHLYWQSEYMSGNCYDGKTYDALISGTSHAQQAIDDAQEVIDAGYSLYDTYSDIWEMDNNASANNNQENIWAINYSQTEYSTLNVDPQEYDAILSGSDPKPFSEREGGCHGHMMFGMRWFAIGGVETVMTKDDGVDLTSTEPTRPFCRYMPTKYLMDLYDASIDQRFYGSFNNVFYANNPDTAAYPVWFPIETLGDGTRIDIDPDLVLTRMLEIGDTAFIMFKDEIIPDDQYIVRSGWQMLLSNSSYFLDMEDIYNEDGTVNISKTNERRAYFDMSKWYDYTRPHNGANQDVIGSQRGKRDFIVFRLPEMYYIQAEANLLLSKNQEAYDALLAIADKRAINGDGAGMLAAYEVTGPSDVTIDFILEDKGREMAGEQHRWFDLKRTGKTLERIRLHNPDAVNIEAKHIVRPIPQVELDAIDNKEDFTTGFGIY